MSCLFANYLRGKTKRRRVPALWVPNDFGESA
jgi:hypothetical protein